MQLDTPCIGICSTVYGDNICRGCKRSYKEIIDWNTYDDTQKNIIFLRLNKLISNVAQDKIIVFDAELLRQTLEDFNIRYRADQSPLCWAYYLLRDARHKILSLEKAGISAAHAYKDYKCSQLYQKLDSELLVGAELEFQNQ